MFKEGLGIKKAYIACGCTDLKWRGRSRRSYSISVQSDPFDEGTMFLFCGRRADRIKGLLWEGDSFILLYKRLSNGRFRWPRSEEEMKTMTTEQYQRLMSGFTIESSIRKSEAKFIL